MSHNMNPLSNRLLSEEERTSLQAFVDRSPSGTAYLRRARIMLLADAGHSQEMIATEADVPIMHVRQMLRAFNRQGLNLFPQAVLAPAPPVLVSDPVAEAGRKIMARLLGKIRKYETDLAGQTSVTGVHETRKSTRRLRTALRLFAPYFEEGLLDAYRKRFRKFMRRLGQSRDTSVFLLKLDGYMAWETIEAEERSALEALREHWETRQVAVDEKVRRYLATGKAQSLLKEWGRFTQTVGEGVRVTEDPLGSPITGHVVPALIYEKVAAVRAYEGHLDGASLKRLHMLRIRCKELRYTLEFFEPVMGPTAAEAIDTVKDLLTHLGDLNDARVHLEMLAETTEAELARAVTHYKVVKTAELERLVEDLPEIWVEFASPAWRQKLAMAVAAI